MGEGGGLLERGGEEIGGRPGGDGEREEERRQRWGAGGCSIGVKRLPEVGNDGGDRDGDVVFCEEVS